MEPLGYRMNVSFPEDQTDLGVLIIIDGNETIKALQTHINKKTRKLLKRGFNCSYITNSKGSLLDPEYTILSALEREDSVNAYQSTSKEHQAVSSKPTKRVHDDVELQAEDEAMSDVPTTTAVSQALPNPSKKKRKKDPLAPKRPMGSFFLFVQEKRPELVAEGLKGKEIAMRTGEMWKTMSDKDKEPYNAKAKELKDGYDETMATYNAKAGSESPVKPSTKKAKESDKVKEVKVTATPSSPVTPAPKTPKDARSTSKKSKGDIKLIKKLGASLKDAPSKKIFVKLLNAYNNAKDENKASSWLKEKLKSDKLVEWVSSTFDESQKAVLLGP